MSPACCGPSRDASDAPSAFETHPARGPAPELVEVPPGRFSMGTEDPHGYAEDGEGPAHPVELAAFEMSVTTVTNAEFARFVAETGHRTMAEGLGDAFVFAGLLPDDAAESRGVVGAPWWRLVDRASWRHPEGPGSDLSERGDHPVVHVSWPDAVAFCRWSGTRLPTEAEWEWAARGGREADHYPWGAEREPGGRHLMNVFQGHFPLEDTGEDGWVGTCPVRSYPPNGYGLHEMTGNVWEWCSDWFDPTYYRRSPVVDPRGPDDGSARVMRGGSYLCHESYCWRYRVDARSSNSPDSTTGNLGFRVVRDLARAG